MNLLRMSILLPIQMIAVLAIRISRSETIHKAVFEMLGTLNRLGTWYLANFRRTVPATLFSVVALWLGRLFDTPMTRAMFSAAGIPMLAYYLLALGVAGYIGWHFFDRGTGDDQ